MVFCTLNLLKNALIIQKRISGYLQNIIIFGFCDVFTIKLFWED